MLYFVLCRGLLKFEFFFVLGCSNFGFLQFRLVGELNFVLFVFVWVLGINGVIWVVGGLFET